MLFLILCLKMLRRSTIRLRCELIKIDTALMAIS